MIGRCGPKYSNQTWYDYGWTIGYYCQFLFQMYNWLHFFGQLRRFISGFLHLRSLLTTMLHMQFWRVNWTPVNGFSMEVHFLGGSNSLAFSGSKENVSCLSKFVNLYVNDILSSWLWENHSKVEDSTTFMKLNWFLVSQLSNN